MVSARCRNLECQTSRWLTPHIGKVGRWLLVLAQLTIGRIRPRRFAVERMHHFTQEAGNSHTLTDHTLRLAETADRHHRTHTDGVDRRAHRGDHRCHPADTAQAAIEAEFTHEAHPFEGRQLDLLTGCQKADSDGQIEARATLTLAAGSQVDGDPARRPAQPTGQHCGAHPVARFATRFVGQTDDLERGQPRGHVHFNGDRATFDAEHRGRTNCGEHDTPPPTNSAAHDAPADEGGNGNRFPDG